MQARSLHRFYRNFLGRARAAACPVVHDGSVSIDPEETLVRSAQAGDRAAFEELVRRTSRLVLARLYLETGDAHRAEDLLQETLLTAFRSLDQLTEPAKFRGWLLRIAVNTAIDAARRDNRRKRSPGELPLRVAPGPDENLERDETRQQVLAVLRSLPEEYRLPLTLRYLAGADYDTIQMQMGLTNGSLRGLLHRGLKRLREELQRAGVQW
jgi:RNA polymerase sigma-70 factor (ECF subfamily)